MPAEPRDRGLSRAQPVLDALRVVAPGAYAAEGYDAMSVFLAALDDGARTREVVETFVDGYTGEGLSKEIAFDENGDVPQENVSYWAYKNEGGTLVPEVEVSP